MALTQVTSAGLKDGEIVNADLHSAAAVAGTKIAPDFGSQNIDTTGNILLDSDSNKLKLGDGEDFQLYHDGTNSRVHNATGELIFRTGTNYIFYNSDGTEKHAKFILNGGVELYYDNSVRLNTNSGGVKVVGHLYADDDDKILLGDSTDLQIYHDGSHSYIQNNTGNFHIGTDGYLAIYGGKDYGETSAKFINDGGVELYYDNSKKFHTNAGGCQIFGNLFNGDSTHHYFGDGNDLDIYHSGTHSFIKDVGTGNLQIWTNQLSLLDSGGTESMIQAIGNGSVEIYYDNSKKFHTHSTGVTISGYLHFEDGSPTTSGIGFGNSDDLLIYHNGSNSIINDNGTGELQLVTNGTKITLQGGSDTMANFVKDGGIQLYHNNSLRCEVQSTGLEVSGGQIQLKGNEGGEAQLQLIADEGDDNDDTWRIIAHVDNRLDISNTASGSWEANLKCHGNGAVELLYDNSVKLQTTSAGAMIAGTSASNVLSLRNTTLGNGSVGILFSTQNHSSGREKAAIYHVETHGGAHYGGDITFCLAQSTGSAQQVTPSDERARIKKGGGITFNGDTADANALNDYEEGNWTPDPHDGNVTVTYARYTKIGRQVTISMRIHSFTDSSTNDQVKLSGIPFSVSEQQGGVGTTMQRYSNDPTAAQAFIFTDNKIYFYGNSTGDYAQLRHNEFNNALFNMHCTMTYYTDL